MGREGIPFEVQIRTREMHEIAEYGVAAHWKYKQGRPGQPAPRASYEWVRRLLENQEGADAEEFIHSLKVDMFADEVFVFTPNGDVQNLPAGATPIDFAYAIHSAVGNRMVGAKVNGRIVTLGPCAEKRRHRGDSDLQERQGPQPGLDEDCQEQRGPHQDPPVVQKGKAGREHRQRPLRLRGGAAVTAASSMKDVTGPGVPACAAEKGGLSPRWTICTPPSAMAASPLRRR